MEYLTTGERVRYFRKLLGISQKELAGNRVSSNLISLIERDKIPLSTVTASILVDNINRFSREKNINLGLGIKDLLMSDEEYLRKQCEEDLKSLDFRTIDKEKYSEILEICYKYNFKEILIKIEEKIGEEYYIGKDYKNAAEHYKRFIETCNLDKSDEIYVNIVYKLGRCCYNLKQYGVALRYFKEILSVVDKISAKNRYYELVYRIALCNFKLRNFAEVERNIVNILGNDGVGEKLLNEVNLLRGNMYLEIGDYYSALNTYRSLIGKNMNNSKALYDNIIFAFDKLISSSKNIS